MKELEFIQKTKTLIDDLKKVCADAGLGNDGNEFKIITQTFLYKFMNDKFAYEIKQVDSKLKNSPNWEEEISKYSEDEYNLLLMKLSPSSAKLLPRHFLSFLFNNQNQAEFAKKFDDTLRDISSLNNDIFAVSTGQGTKIKLFDEISKFIVDENVRDDFTRALINKLVQINFEEVFSSKVDFFSTIFEYLIKDYNKDSGGKYAEYYTPHAVASIMSRILVPNETNNVSIYDPSAGSGSLLMSLAHQIGEDRCTVYSQDISQKSSSLLRLNLILNNLVHSIPNIVQGNTISEPFHKENGKLKKFDYIVSNPPFKLDFSDFRNQLETTSNKDRFFAGIPAIPNKDKDKMAIYLLFIQHIIFSLSDKGKAAIVVPTGFITAQSGIERKIREYLVENQMLRGVVSMPSNIFATTGTNVSIIFLDKTNKEGKVVLMDASKLGETVKDGKNQKTILSKEEEQLIIETFNKQEAKEDFSVVVNYDEIIEKNYSFSAGQYFDIKVKYSDISSEEFYRRVNETKNRLSELFNHSRSIENVILENFKNLKYED